MDQASHIDYLLMRSDEREQQATRIQELYLQCLKEKAEILTSDRPRTYLKERVEYTLECLLLQLDEYCTPWVRRQLWKSKTYTEENEDIALQDARMAVSEVVRNTPDQEQARDNFVSYAFGIYKNKANSVIRSVCDRRKKYAEVSTEEPVGEDGKTIQDLIPAVPFDDGEKEELRRAVIGAFRYYCVAFLTSDAFPPRSLAFCYARVLVHLLDDTVTKATSAKWAYQRMEDRSMDALKEESQHILQRTVDRSLAWGPKFLGQMEEPLRLPDHILRLGDVIFTEVYNKNKIEDWAESMHEKTVTVASALIPEDRELCELIKAYAVSNTVLSRFLGKKKGGKSR